MRTVTQRCTDISAKHARKTFSKIDSLFFLVVLPAPDKFISHKKKTVFLQNCVMTKKKMYTLNVLTTWPSPFFFNDFNISCFGFLIRYIKCGEYISLMKITKKIHKKILLQ